MRDFHLYKDNINIDTRQNSIHYDGQNYIENFNNSNIIAFADQSIMNQKNNHNNNNHFNNDSIVMKTPFHHTFMDSQNR